MGKKKYTARVPRFAAGIRAQNVRIESVRSWWAMRWRAVMENMGLGARLGRGRNYAASGQVVSLKIEGPRVEASVVGTRPDPYQLSIGFRAPTGEIRDRILTRLRAEPIISARLLANDLAYEVEDIVQSEGFDLFPGRKLGPGCYDMTTKCTCPDYANPCKHASAVLLLLGEEIARRPETLLELRGIEARELYEN